MNGAYYPNTNYPNNNQNDYIEKNGILNEDSYIENILRLNRKKKAKIFASFPDSQEYRDRIYDGIIEEAGKDHLIVSSPQTGDWYLIPLIYVNWVEFEEKLNYSSIYS